MLYEGKQPDCKGIIRAIFYLIIPGNPPVLNFLFHPLRHIFPPWVDRYTPGDYNKYPSNQNDN
jgi:hypothetical protein